MAASESVNPLTSCCFGGRRSCAEGRRGGGVLGVLGGLPNRSGHVPGLGHRTPPLSPMIWLNSAITPPAAAPPAAAGRALATRGRWVGMADWAGNWVPTDGGTSRSR